MFKNAYFLATEALAGLLCNARLDHTYRPLPVRALEQAGEVRDADGGVAPVASSVSRVDVVGRPPCVEAFIPFNRVDWVLDAGHGQNGGGHSVELEKLKDEEYGSADHENCSSGDESEDEVIHGSGACSCGGRALGTTQQRPKRLAQRITRVFGLAAGKVADRGLATAALRRDLRLTETEGNQPGDG